MQEKKERRIHLPTIDNYFSTQEERDEKKLEKIIDVKISEIDDFKEHPFRIVVNSEMQNMVDSIKEKGVLSPALVRPKPDGRYEMISGHRRKKASEILELETIPCIVRELTDDEATIIMVDSNLQREMLLPSEKAFAYKMKLEALSHQGKRNDLTCGQVGHKLDNSKSRDILAKEVNDSARQIQRYIRLTNLIPKLLEYVDNSVIKDKDILKIAMSPAVEISYLSQDEQKSLLDYIDINQITPSHAQAIELKEMSQSGKFTIEEMEKLLDVQKPNQVLKLPISMNRLKNVLPKELKNDREREDYVVKAVEFYDKYQKRMKEKKSQER